MDARLRLICIGPGPRAAVAFLLLAVALILPACEREAPPPPPEQALEDWLSDGPLSAHVAVDRLTISTPEDLTVTLETRLDPGYALQEPEIEAGDEFGEWEVARITRSSPVLDDEGRTRIQRRLELRPFLPGEYEVPAIPFAWRAFEGGASGTLETRPVLVEVESVLPGARALKAGELRDVVDPPEPRSNAMAIALMATGSVLLAGGVLWAIARARGRPEAPHSPFAACRQRLARLRRLPLETPAERREVWREVHGLLMLCLAFELEPGASSLSERQLSRRVLAWPGLEPHDQALLIGLFNRFGEALYTGRKLGEDETRELLDAADEGIRLIEASTDAAQHGREAEAAA